MSSMASRAYRPAHDRRALHERRTGSPTPTSSRPGRAPTPSSSTPAARSTPLFEKADEHGLNVTHVLLTHHHHDHVAELGEALERWPDAAVLAHPEERVPGTTGDLSPGDELEIGGLTRHGRCTRPATPRACSSLLVDGRRVHRRHAVQGLGRRRPRARHARRYADLKHSIMDVLLTLPPDTTIRPGHTDPTTVADELESNRVRAHLARARRRGRRAVHRARRAGDADPARATTTTAATRRGCAGPTAATTSCPGSQGRALASKGVSPRRRQSGGLSHPDAADLERSPRWPPRSSCRCSGSAARWSRPR